MFNQRIFCLFAILKFTFVFSLSAQSPQTILENALSSAALERIFDKDEEGKIRPLTLITNNHFRKNIQLQYQGDPITIESDIAPSSDHLYISVNRFEVKSSKRTHLEFYYDDKRVNIKLKNVGGEWMVYSTTVKGKKLFSVDLEF